MRRYWIIKHSPAGREIWDVLDHERNQETALRTFMRAVQDDLNLFRYRNMFAAAIHPSAPLEVGKAYSLPSTYYTATANRRKLPA